MAFPPISHTYNIIFEHPVAFHLIHINVTVQLQHLFYIYLFIYYYYYRKDNITLVVQNEQQAGAHKTTGATSLMMAN
jgi:hypothetical protein